LNHLKTHDLHNKIGMGRLQKQHRPTLLLSGLKDYKKVPKDEKI